MGDAAVSGDVLSVLTAEREIRQTLHDYCVALHALDAERLAALWHADGTLDYEQGALRGPVSGLVSALLEHYRPLEAHSHQVTNTIVAVEGDRALSETYAIESLRAHPDESGTFVVDHYRSRYLDRWSRRDGRWAIDHRDALLSFAWKETVTAGHSSTPSPAGQRDDPSEELFATVGEPSAMNVLGQEWLEREGEAGRRA